MAATKEVVKVREVKYECSKLIVIVVDVSSSRRSSSNSSSSCSRRRENGVEILFHFNSQGRQCIFRCFIFRSSV